MDVNNIGKSTWLQLPPLLPTARWSILRFRIYTCSNKRGGVYADVPSSTVSCLFCEPPDLKQCNEAIEKLWLLSWRFSQTCSQSTCSGKPLEAVTTHVQNYKTIYIGVGEVPEATAQTRVHARRTRRAGRPEGWTGGTGREKISRELQIMDLISDPRMCCLDASTSFEAFSQNPSLKVPYSPVPPLAIHKNLVLLQLSSTHPSQKKKHKKQPPCLSLLLCRRPWGPISDTASELTDPRFASRLLRPTDPPDALGDALGGPAVGPTSGRASWDNEGCVCADGSFEGWELVLRKLRESPSMVGFLRKKRK